MVPDIRPGPCLLRSQAVEPAICVRFVAGGRASPGLAGARPLYTRAVFEIGNSLREARVRQGLEYPQIELATKIRAKYIAALEDEEFGLLPAHTYVKGFLRTYAEFLGLDGQLYVDEFSSRFIGDGMLEG